MALKSKLHEEIEVLQSIYMDDLIVNNTSDNSNTELKITLHPNTADDDEKKYVCLTVHFFLSSEYPKKEPAMTIKNPRGLSDAHLASIEENLKSVASSKIGESMLYELIEYCKDSLTDNNHPSSVCPICLELFQEADKFFRTNCYHYFHLTCMKGYINMLEEKDRICPVCRMTFEIDDVLLQSVEHVKEEEKKLVDIQQVRLAMLEKKEKTLEMKWLFDGAGYLTSLAFLTAQNAEIDFVPTETFLEWRKRCMKLYDEQKTKGGIIDLNFEKNKYLVTMNDSVASGVDETVVGLPSNETLVEEVHTKNNQKHNTHGDDNVEQQTGGNRSWRGGNSLERGGRRSWRGGNSLERGGTRSRQGGNRSWRGGNSSRRGGNSSWRGGNNSGRHTTRKKENTTVSEQDGSKQRISKQEHLDRTVHSDAKHKYYADENRTYKDKRKEEQERYNEEKYKNNKKEKQTEDASVLISNLKQETSNDASSEQLVKTKPLSGIPRTAPPGLKPPPGFL